MSGKHSKRKSTGKFSVVTTCISTTLVLMLLGIVILFVTVGNNFSRQIREGLTVEVMVSDTIHRADLLSLQSFLRQAPFSRRVDYISKERGTREMNEALQGNMGEFIGASPIPAEFEVYLNSAYANLDSLSRFEPELRNRPGVIEVAYPRDVMESLDRTIPMVGLVLLIVAALLALVSFALINNSIRMSVYARRFSIHTMKLVGAEWSFIRRPFLRRAFLIGLVAVLIADGLLGGSLYYLQFMAGEGEVYLNELITPEVWAATLGIVAVCGLLLTVWCAYLSVNRHLRSDESDVYLK
ncbi:MAG: cell division protein FtsX [Alloprevotella sp.]